MPGGADAILSASLSSYVDLHSIHFWYPIWLPVS